MGEISLQKLARESGDVAEIESRGPDYFAFKFHAYRRPYFNRQ